MIAKGLDLPLVTLVGVVSADVGLNLPDFRATERTFQLLTQVAGRAGRGLLGGQVILQTYQPDNPAIRYAAEHDTDGFYASEVTARREMGYPPFRRLARVLLTDSIEARARDMAERAAEILQSRLDLLALRQTTLIGPAPCFFSRLNRQYRWQVLVRGPDPAQVFAEFDLPREWTVMIDPMDVL
jgi:primosomal protein N' (replication factor Y) (superfamily II helicase)